MGALYVRVGGTWVPVAGGADEVYIGTDDPGVASQYELWYDTDAVGTGLGIAPPGRNMFNNGQFAVNQRALTTVSAITNNFLADRFNLVNNGVGTIAGSWVQRGGFGATPPAGRPQPGQIQYLTVTTAEAGGAMAAGDWARMHHAIEGINLQHLNWGTADAKPVTLSFDCYSTIAATYVVELYRPGTVLRQISKTFTTAAAAAGFQTITLTFPGDTTTVVPNDTSAGLYVFFWLAAGTQSQGTPLLPDWAPFVNAREATGISNTYSATVNNIFAITNVQFEVGTVATPYEVKSYQQELLDCQRFFERFDSVADPNTPYGSGMNYSTTQAIVAVPYKVRKRALPTASYATPGMFALYTQAGGIVALNGVGTNQIGLGMVQVNCVTNATQIAGDGTILKANNNQGAFIDISAEL